MICIWLSSSEQQALEADLELLLIGLAQCMSLASIRGYHNPKSMIVKLCMMVKSRLVGGRQGGKRSFPLHAVFLRMNPLLKDLVSLSHLTRKRIQLKGHLPLFF
jgi:hypothetical protein